MLEPIPAITIAAEAQGLLETAHAIVNAAMEGGKVLITSAVPVAGAMLDLDTFEP